MCSWVPTRIPDFRAWIILALKYGSVSWLSSAWRIFRIFSLNHPRSEADVTVAIILIDEEGEEALDAITIAVTEETQGK